jgi:tetratricopeptide (TPR) repeat protein
MLNVQGRLQRFAARGWRSAGRGAAIVCLTAAIGLFAASASGAPSGPRIERDLSERVFQPPAMPGSIESASRPARPEGAGVGDVARPPNDPDDLSGWLEYRRRGHIESLPHQARLFYRSGLMVHRSGQRDDAIQLVLGAAELDPHHVAPHLTLASWFLSRNPSQSLLQYAVVLDLARRNFIFQLAMVANGIYLVMQAVLVGLVVIGFLVVAMHQQRLRHGWTERMARFTSKRTARWWGWGVFLAPFLVGFGPVLPTAVFLGLLWPMLKFRERLVYFGLILFLGTAPLMVSALDMLAVPFREDRGPFHGVATLEGEAYSRRHQERLERLASQNAENPFIQFALGWTARRGGDLAAAEKAYRRTLELWPGNDQVLNNLGNTLAVAGRPDEALDMFREATRRNPENAAAFYNLSQMFTQRFEYQQATDALSRASALDFDLVRTARAHQTNDGFLPLIDQWMAPGLFWKAMAQIPFAAADAPSLPPTWRSRVEFSGWGFSAASVALALLAIFVGGRMNKSIPLRPCSNCGTVVCRRCAERRHELALCPSCAEVERGAESPEFARVILAQHRRARESGWTLMRTALAALIPGFGLLVFGRVFRALFVLSLAAGLGVVWLGLGGPFPYEAGIAVTDTTIPVPLLIGSLCALYLFSLLAYFSLVSKARAQADYIARPQRSRARQASGRDAAAA